MTSMSAEMLDDCFSTLSPLGDCITSGDNAMESNRELQQPENAVSEPQDDVQLSQSSRTNRKRKRQSQETKEQSLKELIEEKSVAQVAKILMDRISRRKDNDMKEDMLCYICLMRDLMANKAVEHFAPIVKSLDKINKKWPARRDLEDIQKMIKEILDDVPKGKKKTIATKEMQKRLLAVGKKIDNLDEQRRQDSTKVKNLEQLFTTEGVSVETLRKKLSLAFPEIFLGEITANEPTAGQDQGNLQTVEHLQYVKNLEDLENELFAKDNNKVDVSDFPGLEEAIKMSTGRNIPDYLELIASKIEKARGKATVFAHFNIQVLVCAAIKEMEDSPVEKLNWDTLKKWGAAFNMAKELGFQVHFAEIRLKKDLYAYFAAEFFKGNRPQ